VIDLAAEYLAMAIHLSQLAFGILAIYSKDYDAAQFLSFPRFQRKIVFQHGHPPLNDGQPTVAAKRQRSRVACINCRNVILCNKNVAISLQ
jgi:hypothetical protein